MFLWLLVAVLIGLFTWLYMQRELSKDREHYAAELVSTQKSAAQWKALYFTKSQFAREERAVRGVPVEHDLNLFVPLDWCDELYCLEDPREGSKQLL